MSDKLKVYEAIAAVTGALAAEGISKSKTNQQQGFKYRGIDDVYNALSSLLAEHKLCILPRITSKEVVERVNAKGTALFYTTVAAEFDMVSAVDGSKHTVSSYGEAMDSGDKSIGKAMSYAYKAMAFMAFCIPTEGDNDPDAQCHEVQPRTAAKPAAPALSDDQQKYFPRIKTALDTLFGSDVAAKKKEIAALTEFKGKDDKMASGVEDYRKLDGKRLEILCKKLESTVEQAQKNATLCNECRQPVTDHAPSCPNNEPPL